MMPPRDEQIALMMAQRQAKTKMTRYSRPNYWEAPKGSVPYDYAASIDYPAVGGPETVILSYQVQQGFRGALRYLGIIHLGGNAPDGTGNVIWRLRLNGACIAGYANNTFEVGNADGQRFGNLADVYLGLAENDLLQATVQVVGGAALTGVMTAARFRGFEVSSIGGVLQ